MRRTATLLGIALGLSAASCATLPPAPPHALVKPRLDSLPAIQLCWLETGGADAPAGFASAGLSTSPKWEATASALLIRHPQGDVLIDTGAPWELDSQVAELFPLDRLLIEQNSGRLERRGRIPELLRSVGVNPARLTAIILSHAHPDHGGGLTDLPGIPVLLAPEEIAFVHRYLHKRSQMMMPAQGRAMLKRMQPLAFESGPYETFDQSADIFGDGSVVMVKLPGHTPGSVGTFVNLPGGLRLFHVGDVVTIEESVTRRVPKSRLMQLITDKNIPQTDLQVSRLAQLHELEPGLTILPAHDRAVWQRIFGAMEPKGPVRCVGAKQGP